MCSTEDTDARVCTAAGRGATGFTPEKRAPRKDVFARTETRDATAVAPSTGIAIA